MRSAKDDLIDDLREENARLRSLFGSIHEYLLDAEWSLTLWDSVNRISSDGCPGCMSPKHERSHAIDCPIAAALREGDDPDN